MHYIYVIKNSINEKVYVGQTRNLSQRWSSHRYSARKDHRALYVAMREIGVENFTFELLEECSDEQTASDQETLWVEKFNSFNSGYNLTSGGGYHVGNKGRKFSDEHKRKLSAALKGKIVSQEARENMSLAMRKRFAENSHPMKGKHHTEDAHQNMSEASQALWASERGEEIREKIRETLTGFKHSDETKKRWSEQRQGRKHSQETIDKMKTRVFSEEHRQRLSDAAKRRRTKEI